MKKTLTLLLLLAGLTLDAQAEPLTWNGAEGRMTWNTSYNHWLQGGEPVLYKDGSDVVFGDNGSGEVVLDGTLKPGSVLVEADNDYIFSGEGKLSGKMTLTKNGSGTLTINTANEYSGGTIINSGTLVLGHDKALGTGDVTLGSKTDSATLDLDGHTLKAHITVCEETNDKPTQIGNGTVNGSISLGYRSYLTLIDDLSGTGEIIMDPFSSLSCNGHILNKDVIITTTPTSSLVHIDAGTINGSIRVAEHAEMDLHGDLHGTGTVTLEEGTTLYCDPISTTSSVTLYKDVTLTGSAYLYGASIIGNVTVSEGKCLSLKIFNSRIAGTITLGEGASLNMENLTLTMTDGSVVLSGANAQVGGGTLNGNVTVGEDKKLTLSGDLDGTGSITLGDKATLDLGKHTLSTSVSLAGSSASIGNGTLNSDISVDKDGHLTMIGDLNGTGSITLGDKATLDLGKHTLSTSVSLTGDTASIGNGTVNGTFSVDTGKTLFLIGNLTGDGSFSLGDKATLDLGKYTLSKGVTLAGSSAQIGNGELAGTVSVDTGKTLFLIDNLTGDGSVNLAENAKLDLGNHSLATSVTLTGYSAQIGNGEFNGNLSVGTSNTITLFDNLGGAGIISLGDKATLDLGTHSLANSITLTGDASVGNGTYNGSLYVGIDRILTLHANLEGTGNINLSNGAMLDLGTKTTSTGVIVTGSNATIGNGTLNGNVTVEEGKSLFLKNDVALNKAIILDDGASLDMDGAQAKLSKFTFTGQSTAIDNAELIVEGGETVTLTTNLSGSATISLGDSATLDLGQHTLPYSVTLAGHASIGNGTLNSDLSVDKGGHLTLIGDLSGTGTITLGDITTLNLGGYHLSHAVSLVNTSAFIGYGTLNSDLSMGARVLTLIGDLDCTGNITLGEGAYLTLLDDVTLRASLTLTGNVSIGSEGETMSALYGYITVEAGNTLTFLSKNLNLRSLITLGDKAVLNLGGSTAQNKVTLSGDASIGGGTVGELLSVGDEKTLTLIDDLRGLNTLSLGDNATLDLSEHALSGDVTLAGSSANIGNGTHHGTFSVDTGKTLFLIGNLTGDGSISLGDNATLDLGKYTLSKGVTLAGSSAQIGNGELAGTVSVDTGKTLFLIDDLTGDGSVNLAENAKLDLGNHSLATSVTLTGSSAEIGKGKLDGSLSVDDGKSLSLLGELSGTGTISLGRDTTLYLNNHTLYTSVTLTGNAGIGGGTFNGSLEVGAGNTLSLLGDLSGDGSISLGDNATLDLYDRSLSGDVTLAGDSAQIGGGKFKGTLEVGANKTLSLIGDLSGDGSISLGDNATLDLYGQPLSVDVTLTGTASILSGTHNGSISVEAGKTLFVVGDISGTGSVNLAQNAKLNLLYLSTLSKDVTLTGSDATISDGTVKGNLTAKQGASARISGATIEAGATTVSTFQWADTGLLKEISVSEGLIAGIDRQTSLADGLNITSESDLMIKSMTITTDNEIYVGQHIITLQDVTIKLSDDICKLKERTFYFDLTYLINCDLVMENVLLDASDLTLPQGFDPATDTVAFDFGPDVTIDKETANNLTLLMGDYLSTTANLDTPGQVLFTALVPIPEPTTGTLSMLALAALAARRRRK